MENNEIKNNLSNEANNKPIYKKKSLYIGIILILIVVGAGVYWYLGNLGYASTDDAFISANKLNLSAKMLGRVVHLYAAEGDEVKQGELLAELDSTDLVARYNQAKTTLGNVKISISLSKINLEQAQSDFNRAKYQYKNNVIPQVEFDHIQTRLKAAQAQYKLAQSRIPTIKAQLNVIKTELANTKLYSTINGVVAKKWVLKGEVVAPGQSIYTIYNLKNIWVTAELQETELNYISIGDTVQINVDAYPNEKFIGKIFQIGNNTAAQFSLIPPSNASGNFTKVTQRISIKISIEKINKNRNFRYGLLPGMSVEIKIKLNNHDRNKIK